MVHSAAMCRDEVGKFNLVRIFSAEVHRKSVYRAIVQLCGDRSYAARIYAARKVCCDWFARRQPFLHQLFPEQSHLLTVPFQRAIGVSNLLLWLPVALWLHIIRQAQVATRPQLSHRFPQRLRSGYKGTAQIVAQSNQIEFLIVIRIERSQSRRNPASASLTGVIERFGSDAIAPQTQRLLLALPHSAGTLSL